VVSTTDPYGRILWFLDRSRYFFFQAAPQLYSGGYRVKINQLLLLLLNICSFVFFFFLFSIIRRHVPAPHGHLQVL
jgi:hypothetical protein